MAGTQVKIKTIFLCIVISNVFILFYLFLRSNHKNKTIELDTSAILKNESTYSFDHPGIANSLLKKLTISYHTDRFSPFDQSSFPYQSSSSDQLISLKPAISGIMRNTYYCIKVLNTFVHNFSLNFFDKNFVTDYKPNELLRRKVIPTIGHDLKLKMSHIKQRHVAFSLPTTANMFFMHSPLLTNF